MNKECPVTSCGGNLVFYKDESTDLEEVYYCNQCGRRSVQPTKRGQMIRYAPLGGVVTSAVICFKVLKDFLDDLV